MHALNIPQDIDAEKSLLCAFFLAPDSVGQLCVAEGITEGTFHAPPNRIIFRHQFKAWTDGLPVDFFLIQSAIRDAGELDECGGPSYLTEIAGFSPSAAVAPHFARIIRDKESLRLIMREAQRAISLAAAATDAPAALAEVQEAFLAISARKRQRRKVFREHLTEAVNRIASGSNETADICSGLTKLDALVRMRKGNVIIVSGAPKSGKTALAGNIIAHAAVRQKKRVVLFSLEMSDSEQTDRFLSCEGKLNVSTLGPGMLEHEHQRLMRAVSQLTDADITLVTDATTWPEILATARQLHAQRPIDLICLDYLQLVSADGETREQQVAGVSRGFKGLCAQLGAVGIGLSQLNEQGKLRESRSIGQDANAVLAVEITEEGGRAINIVAQRSGTAGVSVPVRWHPQWTKFEDAD